MRVNITYSVELDEVSELVEKILHEIEEQFENMKRKLGLDPQVQVLDFYLMW